MNIIEIKALENGAHRNQSSNSILLVPEGWAVIPDGMETPNFPFGDITTEKVDGVMTVTSWTAGIIPEVTAEEPVSPMERMRADIDFIAAMKGIEL